MSYLDCILTAFVSLRANLMRSVLTALGIIIGVAAVIAMVAIGSGAEHRMQTVIQSLGTNLLIVLNGTTTAGGRRAGWGSKFSLTEGDEAALQREIEGVQVAGAAAWGSGQVVYSNANWYTSYRGVTNGYFEARDWVVETGRGFTEGEQRAAAKVVLLGATVAENLFGNAEPVGQSIRINRVPFVVIGVMLRKGQTPFGSDQDDVLFMPLSSAKKRVLGGRRLGGDLVSEITVKARSAEEMAVVEEQVKELLRRRHKIREGQNDDFYVRNLTQMLEARAESSRVMSVLLASVAGVSLIVGGIGIMNIMLVSVMERTAEIGLRMALGARARDVMAQFVVEAVSLSIIGGLVGVGVGIGGSHLLSYIGEWPVLIEGGAVLMAVAFAAAVGIFFGYYPARKAASLDPITALRHE
jgi:putative ABC transport system permease protein